MGADPIHGIHHEMINGNAYCEVSLYQRSPFSESYITAILKSHYLIWSIETRHNTL